MKILLICDYYKRGGAELYAHNLIEILNSNGHEIRCICFENKASDFSEEKQHYYWVPINKLESKLGKLFKIPRITRKIKNIAKEYSPDIVILNSEYNCFFSVIQALKSYNIYNIVHDYRPICHNANCLHDDNTLCNGYKQENCLYHCKNGYRKSHLLLKRWNAKKIEKNNKRYIKLNIAPSESLTKYCKNYGYRCECINNPINFTLENIELNNKKKNSFLYVGKIDRDKGIINFLQYFIEFNSMHGNNQHLSIVGGVDERFSEQFEKLINNKNIEYIGAVEHSQIQRLMHNAYCIVVPSLWMENYPTVVLEAFASGTIVLGSNRGGVQELIANGRGVLFDPLSGNSIFNALEEILKMEAEQYTDIVFKGQKYLISHNRADDYYCKLLSLISKE